DTAQNVIPLTQWMIPANKNIVLPDCYKEIVPEDAKTLSYDEEKVSAAVNPVMDILGN
ncbi:MAG TPA: thiamine ABC transporter substrate-binding protein, partial [Treponema sp.]|nr:thiamine ABC transporter substrate-binding protein [Treponema sp.]